MKPEYREGPKALRDFERLASAILRAPKAGGRTEKSSKKASGRKSKPSDKD